MTDPIKPTSEITRAYPIRYDFVPGSMEDRVTNVNTVFQVLQDTGQYGLRQIKGEGWLPGAERGLASLLYIPITEYFYMFNHEFSGHGSRIIELGSDPEYYFDLSLSSNWSTNGRIPMSSGDTDLVLDHPYFIKRVRTTMGGTEANEVFAHQVAQRAFSQGGRPTDIFSYVFKRDISLYIRHSLADPESDDDISDYQKMMDRLMDLERSGTLDIDTPDVPGFSTDVLKAGAIWNVIDPTLWYFAYQYARWVKSGDDAPFQVPDFLPRTYFYLTEDGPEFHAEVPLRAFDMSQAYYVRTTLNDKMPNAYGFGACLEDYPVTNLIKGGLQLDIFRQPRLAPTLGFNLGVEGTISLADHFALQGGVGYKTKGFVPGKPIADGPTGFIGLNLRL